MGGVGEVFEDAGDGRQVAGHGRPAADRGGRVRPPPTVDARPGPGAGLHSSVVGRSGGDPEGACPPGTGDSTWGRSPGIRLPVASAGGPRELSLIHISEPTRRTPIS